MESCFFNQHVCTFPNLVVAGVRILVWLANIFPFVKWFLRVLHSNKSAKINGTKRKKNCRWTKKYIAHRRASTYSLWIRTHIGKRRGSMAYKNVSVAEVDLFVCVWCNKYLTHFRKFHPVRFNHHTYEFLFSSFVNGFNKIINRVSLGISA